MTIITIGVMTLLVICMICYKYCNNSLAITIVMMKTTAITTANNYEIDNYDISYNKTKPISN